MDTMDTPSNSSNVDAKLDEIKRHMPETYKAIQSKAGAIGREAYRFVRQGVGGQANRFYAVEGGRVVGTPFDIDNVADEIARYALQFGISFLIMWAPEAQQIATKQTEVVNGAD
jgi:hypothetical protein